jgi:hypothetical protein
MRRRQLLAYLEERLATARYLLVGEALGYQGGHFTGIAMTSERLLLGGLAARGVEPKHAFRDWKPVRTSRVEIRRDGFSEPTATIVWSRLLELGLDPFAVVLWNAVPFHPYRPDKGMLSNRTPKAGEFTVGAKYLERVLSLLPGSRVLAVGRRSAEVLAGFGVDCGSARHPAQGGATEFRRQVAAWIESFDT